MRVIQINQHLALVAGRDGYFLVNRNDFYIGQALEIYGEHGASEAQFLKRLVKPGDHVIEVGANIGTHTVGLAKQVGPVGKVFAFEPQRACFALLQAQIALNLLDNILAFNEGLGAQRGELFMPVPDYLNPGNFGAVSLVEDGAGRREKVQVGTLDQHFPEGFSAALVKIDVEGMERQVLEGGQFLLERCKPLLYLENDRVAESPALIDFLLQRGYRLYWHIPPLFNPANCFNVSRNVYGNVASFNMLGVPGSRNIEETAGLREIRSAIERHPLAG